MELPFFKEIERSENVLVAGAGGGFDVFAGLPLVNWLRRAGKAVHLASLSSGALGFCDAESPVRGLWRITSRTATTANYFPEIHLARWLSDRLGESVIYAIEPSGAKSVIAAYEWMGQTLRPDTVILVDGGTDSLMRGDEAGLGTPEGDALSLLAANSMVDVVRKYLVCIGFGIDTHHGVCHAHFLENVAALIARDAYLGAWSLTREMEDFTFYSHACDYVFARLPRQPSIVNTSIISAVNGSFGDFHLTKRTEGSTLFINPLMSIYWTFQLKEVAAQNLFLERIRNTETPGQVSMEIERFQESLPKVRSWQELPF